MSFYISYVRVADPTINEQHPLPYVYESKKIFDCKDRQQAVRVFLDENPNAIILLVEEI